MSRESFRRGKFLSARLGRYLSSEDIHRHQHSTETENKRNNKLSAHMNGTPITLENDDWHTGTGVCVCQKYENTRPIKYICDEFENNMKPSIAK